MELEETIRMAREAGALVENFMSNPPRPGAFYMTPSQLQAFANAIEARAAAKEREACADIVENAHTPDCGGWTAQGIADAIRARGATDEGAKK